MYVDSLIQQRPEINLNEVVKTLLHAETMDASLIMLIIIEVQLTLLCQLFLPTYLATHT